MSAMYRWFLFIIVSVSCAYAQGTLPNADVMKVAKGILAAINKGKLLQPYDKSFAPTPLDGAFFLPLWELSTIYRMYATLGLPAVTSNLPVALNPKISVGDVIAVYDDASEQFQISNSTQEFTTFALVNAILHSHAEQSHSVVMTKADCANYEKLKDPGSRIAYNEAVRPRYYLALFIDSYRVLIKAHESCRREAKGKKCVNFFQDYQHMLWMYSWVICQYIGSSPSLDVDGICPKLCRPHTKGFVESMAFSTIQGPSLFYAADFDENALDICEQMQFALPGSCSLTGAGVGMLDFKCDCASNAYEWKTTEDLRGCLLKDSIMATANTSNATNWHVVCSAEDNKLYCDPQNTEVCYYRLWKESKEPELNLTTFVRQSRTPFCHCKRGFAGTKCSDKFDPCLHNIPLAINDPENYVNIHIPEGPFMPLYSLDELSGASGNWLCGVKAERGTCKVTNDPDFPFKCVCAKSFERDELYSDQDNCMKEASLDRATEIDGRPAINCGKEICTRGAKCVYKIRNANMEYNITETSSGRESGDQFDLAEVCQCPVGYVGSNCDVEENTWSEWEAWSPCVPNCGRMRYKYRVRMCVGDTGCVGSAMESYPCPKTECPLLSTIKASGKSAEYSEDTGHYYQLTQASLLSWMLGLVVPLEVLLVLVGVIVLEKCILKSH